MKYDAYLEFKINKSIVTSMRKTYFIIIYLILDKTNQICKPRDLTDSIRTKNLAMNEAIRN